jgi:hypothetical protein
MTPVFSLFIALCAVGFLARLSYALARTPMTPLFALMLGAGAVGFLMVARKPESSATRAVTASPRPEVGLGALEGLMRLAGDEVPSSTCVENATDPVICGRTKTLEDLLVSASNRGIQNVIVALTDVPRQKIPLRRPGRLVLDNRECRFVPHASVLTVGSTVEATNSDPVLHTTHLYGAIEANIALPFEGSSVTRVIDKPGIIVIRCDVHGWMQAFIRVDDHPFHAVSDATGSFRIENIPAGTYHLEAWHEKLGLQNKTVRIEARKTERIEMEYSPGK